ncbi:MAG TPA: NmrA family NAD(P)-binding protein, partial [Thermoanaerobaculia bacterium]|nr:NmrA family NAD(P)-binding protein [Thermoanaerobaculia bacterium]
MKVLVIGGTGTVGSQVVRELVTRGADVTVLTRDPGKAKGLPQAARLVRGDLLDPATVRSVFTGMEGVFLLNAVSATESHEGLMAVNGARMAGVARIAYLSVHNVDQHPQLPHFGSKVPIEMALKESGIACTILRANNFYQNDYWFKDALLQYGVYPQPLGDAGLSRVDVRDIA